MSAVFGWFVLVILSLVALWSSLAVAERAQPSGRAEAALIVTLCWSSLIVFPVHLLGWANRLDAARLGFTVLSSSLLLLALSLIDGGRAHVYGTWWLARSLFAAPWDVVKEAWEKRSFALVGLVGAAGVMLYTAWLSYLAPSTGWDGIWYHETIVGFALQNRGFALEPLPLSLEYINGFPRACEAMNLWFVVFTDRRWIEIVNSIMAAPLLFAVYAIARRFTDRVTAAGWAAALLWMPGALLQMRSTYIDLHTSAYVMIAAYFCSKVPERLRDAWWAALSLSLVAGTKGLALYWVPLLAVTPCVTVVVKHFRSRPFQTVATLLGAVVLISALAGPFYLRNWLVHHNPIWPVRFNSARLGIHWTGWVNVQEGNRSLGDLADTALSVPQPGKDYHDTRVWGYGLGVPWLVFPTCCIALGAAVVRSVVGWLPRRDRARDAEALLLATLPLLLTLVFTPRLQNARYNIHAVGAMMILAAWATRGAWARMGEAIMGATIATSMMMLYWAKPGWAVPFSSALDLARRSPAERTLFQPAGYAASREYRRARLREIGAGDVVLFGDDYGFPAEYWNERFDNRVRYLRSTGRAANALAVADKEHAKWIIAAPNSPLYSALSSSPEWQRVAAASLNRVTYAFGRGRDRAHPASRATQLRTPAHGAPRPRPKPGPGNPR